MTDDAPHRDDDWCNVAEAARRLGVTPTAIRNRIKRGTLETKPNGNHGHLVRVPVPEPVPLTVPEPVPEPSPSPIELELRSQIADLQSRFAASQADLVTMARETGASQAEIAGLVAQLADAKADRDAWRQEAVKPWWRRLVG